MNSKSDSGQVGGATFSHPRIHGTSALLYSKSFYGCTSPGGTRAYWKRRVLQPYQGDSFQQPKCDRNWCFGPRAHTAQWESKVIWRRPANYIHSLGSMMDGWLAGWMDGLFCSGQGARDRNLARAPPLTRCITRTSKNALFWPKIDSDACESRDCLLTATGRIIVFFHTVK